MLACGGSTTGNQATADDEALQHATCSTSDDCVVVFSGERCSCSCDVVAIARRDEAEWRDRHEPKEQCGISCGPCAQAPAPKCLAGQCQLP